MAKREFRTVYNVISDTPANQRWFRKMAHYYATWDESTGYTVHNESRWADILSASNTKELTKP